MFRTFDLGTTSDEYAMEIILSGIDAITLRRVINSLSASLEEMTAKLMALITL